MGGSVSPMGEEVSSESEGEGEATETQNNTTAHNHTVITEEIPDAAIGAKVEKLRPLEQDRDMILIVKIKVATMEINYKIKQIQLFKARREQLKTTVRDQIATKRWALIEF